MLTLIDIICKIVGKGLELGAKIALSRVTIIITFAATVVTTFTAIYSSLTDVDSTLSSAASSIESISEAVADFIQGNEYFYMISYSLSLDTLTSGIITTLFWTVVTLGGALLTALFTVVVSVAPILSELVVAAIKKQYANAAK